MEFITKDEKSKKIKKLAFMLKELYVNIYIYGDSGTGKTFLANFIANNDDLIIESFDELKEFIKTDKRIIGIGKTALNENIKEKYDISVEIFLDNLDKREKDVKEFTKYFINEVKENLKIKEDIEVNIDISENLNSLKIFDKGLFQAFIKKYPSKLQMAKALKINRGILAKKWSNCEI